MAVPLSSFSLFPATPEQVLESRKRSFVFWGTGWTLESYLLRDATCDAFEAARDGKLITWYAQYSSSKLDIEDSLEFEGVGPKK